MSVDSNQLNRDTFIRWADQGFPGSALPTYLSQHKPAARVSNTTCWVIGAQVGTGVRSPESADPVASNGIGLAVSSERRSHGPCHCHFDNRATTRRSRSSGGNIAVVAHHRTGVDHRRRRFRLSGSSTQGFLISSHVPRVHEVAAHSQRPPTPRTQPVSRLLCWLGASLTRGTDPTSGL